tara:strand:+ start:104 stop:412 length:309 start_codon:yes stop_codon:yes gene_type:complete
MTKDDIIRMAVKCQLLNTGNRGGIYADALETFANLVAADEREACAQEAGKLWIQCQAHQRAHERNSLEPFNMVRYGFDEATIQQSQKMMDDIRAKLKEKNYD